MYIFYLPINEENDTVDFEDIAALPWSNHYAKYYPGNSVVTIERKISPNPTNELVRPGLPNNGDPVLICSKLPNDNMCMYLAEIMEPCEPCNNFWTYFRSKRQKSDERWYSFRLTEGKTIIPPKSVSQFYKTLGPLELEKKPRFPMFNSSITIKTRKAKEYVLQCIKSGGSSISLTKEQKDESPQPEVIDIVSPDRDVLISSPSSGYDVVEDITFPQFFTLNPDLDIDFSEFDPDRKLEPAEKEADEFDSLLIGFKHQISAYANKRKRSFEEAFEAEKKQKTESLKVEMEDTWNTFLVNSRNHADEMEKQLEDKLQLRTLQFNLEMDYLFQKEKDRRDVLVEESLELVEENLKLRQELQQAETDLLAKRTELSLETEKLENLRTKLREEQDIVRNEIEQTKTRFELNLETKKKEFHDMLSNSIKTLFRPESLMALSDKTIV